MASVSPPVPTEAALQSLRDELKGNVFRDVNGLLAKYFQGKPWSEAVENKLHEPKSARLVSRLAAGVPGLSDVDAVVEWLADFQTLFFAADQANFHVHSHPISSADPKAGTAIYLERSNLQSAAGSTAVFGILTGQRHTYRHDLESLFYVFLWIAIANDRVHDEATDILEGLPTTSKLRKWCTMDFSAVGRDKAADMSAVGFGELLDEFSPEFASLRGLARDLHTLLFPVRDGKIFTGTDTDQVAVQTLYDGMAGAFHRSSLAFQ